MARTVVNSFVISRIDYCNCLLAVAPQYQLNRLQAVMNSAGRLICGLNKFDRISRVLRDRLHWLPCSSTTDTVPALFAGLQVFTWSCTMVSSRLLPTCVIRRQWQKQTAIVHTWRPRRRLSCDGFWMTLFCRVCTTGVEPAATRDQEQSVAGIFQVSTQDSSVQLH